MNIGVKEFCNYLVDCYCEKLDIVIIISDEDGFNQVNTEKLETSLTDEYIFLEDMRDNIIKIRLSNITSIIQNEVEEKIIIHTNTKKYEFLMTR